MTELTAAEASKRAIALGAAMAQVASEAFQRGEAPQDIIGQGHDGSALLEWLGAKRLHGVDDDL